MAKKRNAWEGRGTFKNPKWEWTKGSICLRSCVFHHRCRQLAAAPLKTISIPSTDASTCPPPFALSVRCRVNSHFAIAKRGDETRTRSSEMDVLLSSLRGICRPGRPDGLDFPREFPVARLSVPRESTDIQERPLSRRSPENPRARRASPIGTGALMRNLGAGSNFRIQFNGDSRAQVA